jgi:hypothetical protein
MSNQLTDGRRGEGASVLGVTMNLEMCAEGESTYIIYLEYHSACPLVRVGTPTPSPESECVPPGTKGGVDTLACG